jgi:hypothetical protein
MLNIFLADAIEVRLLTEAESRGVSASEYAAQLIERVLSGPSVDEVLAGFRKQVSESGLSDEALDALMEESREDAWRERRENIRE